MSVHRAELRWRVVSTYEEGEGSYQELAERFVLARMCWMLMFSSWEPRVSIW